MIDEKIKDKICEDYKNGVFIAEIFKKYHLSRSRNSSSYLYKILLERNIPLRVPLKSKMLKEKNITNFNVVKEKEIKIHISPNLYNLMEEFCKKRNISVELFIKKYFNDYIWKMCEGLGII